MGKCDGDGGHQNDSQPRINDIGLNGHGVDHAAAVEKNQEDDWVEVGGCPDKGSGRSTNASISFVSSTTPGETHQVNAAGETSEASTLIMPTSQVKDITQKIFLSDDHTEIISRLEELNSTTIEAVQKNAANEMRLVEQRINAGAEEIVQLFLNPDALTEDLNSRTRGILLELKPSYKKRKFGRDNLGQIDKWLINKRIRAGASRSNLSG